MIHICPSDIPIDWYALASNDVSLNISTSDDRDLEFRDRWIYGEVGSGPYFRAQAKGTMPLLPNIAYSGEQLRWLHHSLTKSILRWSVDWVEVIMVQEKPDPYGYGAYSAYYAVHGTGAYRYVQDGWLWRLSFDYDYYENRNLDLDVREYSWDELRAMLDNFKGLFHPSACSKSVSYARSFSFYENGVCTALPPAYDPYSRDKYIAWLSYLECDMMPYAWRQAVGECMLEAFENLPDISIGLIANILDLASSIATIASNIRSGSLLHEAAKLGEASNAWLTYRYAVTTTTLDIEEYKLLIQRLNDLATISKDDITLHGTVTHNGVKYRLSFDVGVSQLIPDTISDVWSQFGGDLSPAAIWDLIPYSFVADWFLGIGDFLENCTLWSNGLSLHPHNLWFSIQSQSSVTEYARMPISVDMAIPPLYGSKATSKRTLIFRLFDSIALIS